MFTHDATRAVEPTYVNIRNFSKKNNPFFANFAGTRKKSLASRLFSRHGGEERGWRGQSRAGQAKCQRLKRRGGPGWKGPQSEQPPPGQNTSGTTLPATRDYPRLLTGRHRMQIRKPPRRQHPRPRHIRRTRQHQPHRRGTTRQACWVPTPQRSAIVPVARVPKTALLEGQVTRIPHPPPRYLRRGITRVCCEPLIAARSVSHTVARDWKIMLLPLLIRIAVG